MIESPLFYLVAAVAVLIVGISKGGFVGGFGMLAVPMMAMLIDPRQAAAILLPILCVMDIFAVKAFWGNWDKQALKSIIPGAIIGIIFGTITFTILNADHIRIVVGAVTILFVLQYWFIDRHKKETSGLDYNTVKGGICGALSGFTSFIAHAGGGPLSMYLFPLKLDKTKLMATSVIFFITVNYIKLIPYAWLGQLSSENLMTSLVLLPLAPIGVKLGVWMHHKVSNDIFYIICYIALFFTGLKLVYEGFTNL
ncbi:MAG: sulfite exporter TauE/SafE family protein [Kordiimonadaceae bacterium]|nr:sulfite exporter TauE/SafE family protein [Kordiimonadaceae bacterium]MBT6031027.1 sulfite exporter TauE/SafE family protein [Kordiimonadaceae bacterium]